MLALVLACSLIAVSCGNDDDDAGAADPPAAAPAADEPMDEPAGDEPMDEPAADEPMDEPMDEPAADQPMDEPAADEPMDEPMEEPAPGVDLTGADLVVWGWASSEAEDVQLTALVDQFNADTGADASFEPQPEFDTSLQAALVAGDPPDLFYVDSSRLPDLVASGALAPVPDGVLSDPDDIYPALREIFTIDGTWYCPPKDFSTLGLVYDPTAFAEAGVDVPTTWEELAAAAEALTTDDRVGLSFGAEYARAGAFLFQAGTNILTPDGTAVAIDSDGARAALGFLADLFAAGHAATPQAIDTGWGGEAFGSGNAAMTIEGNWIVGYLNNSFPDREWAVAELPSGPAGPGTFAFTVCYGVAASADDPERSWAFADYLTNAAGAAAWTSGFQVMPARASVRDGWVADNPELGAFIAGAAYASPFQFPTGVGDIQGVFNDNFQQLISGDVTVDELIEEVVEAGEDLL
ncbi:extracellular solute-binding protein [Candidatus Poriferisocius sp.]|uniref:extracellular solute-binding protein n=1 Tax=Candidatus Poriferisocius sp. TaxID=3101276 RepID=UPI003B5AEEB6